MNDTNLTTSALSALSAPEAQPVDSPLHRSTVLKLVNQWVSLSSTNFVPACNGRSSDIGRISSVPVDKVVMIRTGTVFHRLVTAEPHSRLKVGDVVDLHIDLEVRSMLMRNHSLQHLAGLAITTLWPNSQVTKGLVEAEKAALEVVSVPSIGELIDSSATWIRSVVDDDLRILRLPFGPPTNQTTFWYVDGLGSVRCYGTHPRTTGQLGDFVISGHNVGNGTVRLTIGAVV